MSVQFHELRVSAVVRETAECCSFELSVPAELREAYRYKAGQHLTFELPWEDFKITRCYSLSSCADLGEPLKIGVKRVEGGRISNWLNDNLKVGAPIMASVPEGRFVLDPETRSSAPLFLFAGGSGITPIIALLKSALAITKRSVTVLYANQDRNSVIYGEELDRLATEHSDRLVVRHHFDSEGGYLAPGEVRALIHHTDIAEFYICGPEPFMELIETTLDEAGVHEELVYIERFVSPADPDRVEVEAVDVASLEAPDTFSLWLDGRSRTVPYMKGKTLLQCAQAAGLQPTHSCESGYCGSCMANVKAGRVHMRTHEALSDRDIARGVALLCQSVPASSEQLELDSDSTSFRTASAVKSSYSKRVSQLVAVAAFAFMVAGTLVLRLVH
ncbi:MAG: ferredoxin--NADP reductase [Deltaproteobacteria bacterium]|nr:ferredoxin--NADP reductase [Deltaproteobacteria bacterium]